MDYKAQHDSKDPAGHVKAILTVTDDERKCMNSVVYRHSCLRKHVITTHVIVTKILEWLAPQIHRLFQVRPDMEDSYTRWVGVSEWLKSVPNVRNLTLLKRSITSALTILRNLQNCSSIYLYVLTV